MSESRPLPCAEIAEQAIITTIFQDPERFLPMLRASGVTAETFYKHRRLFQEVETYIDTHGSIELIAFIQHLQIDGTTDLLGGVASVTEALMFHTYGSYGWVKWIEQIQEAHALRIAQTLHMRPGEYETSDDALAALTKAVDAISSAKSGPSRSATAKESADAFIDQFMRAREAGDIPGKSTGFHEIDSISGGMRAGELWVVCGQTSRGKSVLMLQIAAEVIRNNERVAIFSMEMGKEEVIGRLVTVMGRIDYNQITKPREVKTKHDVQKIQETLKLIAEKPFRIDDAGKQTIDHIEAEAKMISDTEGPIGLVVVDYLQLVSGERGRNESREQEVARISRGLKQLAKQLKCPVISASQLNDDGKVRESRAIAQDADALLFIVEDGIKIGKLRNGQRDSVLPLTLDGRFQRFARR